MKNGGNGMNAIFFKHDNRPTAFDVMSELTKNFPAMDGRFLIKGLLGGGYEILLDSARCATCFTVDDFKTFITNFRLTHYTPKQKKNRQGRRKKGISSQ